LKCLRVLCPSEPPSEPALPAAQLLQRGKPRALRYAGNLKRISKEIPEKPHVGLKPVTRSAATYPASAERTLSSDAVRPGTEKPAVGMRPAAERHENP
jgi:hypothetical protein